MAMIEVKCPMCRQTDVVKHGVDAKGKQRFVCRNRHCIKKTFQLEYELNAKYEGITEKIIDHAMNANGIRDTARILKISPTTVIDRLKQQAHKIVQFNLNYLNSLTPEDKKKIRPKMCIVQEAEADEMWSYVGKKEGGVSTLWIYDLTILRNPIYDKVLLTSRKITSTELKHFPLYLSKLFQFINQFQSLFWR